MAGERPFHASKKVDYVGRLEDSVALPTDTALAQHPGDVRGIIMPHPTISSISSRSDRAAAFDAMGKDGGVKRSTAIRHLVEMALEASELLGMHETDIGWPLKELWVTGELLDTDAELDSGSVILMLDVAPIELPWLARHPAGEWVGDRLRSGRRPMLWCYRPSAWPPWNARHQRVARIWSAAMGLDEAVIEALRSGAAWARTVDSWPQSGRQHLRNRSEMPSLRPFGLRSRVRRQSQVLLG